MIALVALVLFGAQRLPELGRGLGDGIRNFKKGLRDLEEDDAKAAAVKEAAAREAARAREAEAARQIAAKARDAGVDTHVDIEKTT